MPHSGEPPKHHIIWNRFVVKTATSMPAKLPSKRNALWGVEEPYGNFQNEVSTHLTLRQKPACFLGNGDQNTAWKPTMSSDPMKHKRVGNFHKWNERRNFPQCSNSVLHCLPQSSRPPQWVDDNLQVNRAQYRMLHRLCVSHVKSLREGGIGSVLCSSVQNFVRQSSHEATGQTTQSCLRNEPGALL